MTAKCPITTQGQTSAIIKYLRNVIVRKYGSGQQRRIFHAKTIGVVKGTLVVEDMSSSARLAVGLFKTPGVYKDVTIRFTKGNSSIGPDGKKSVHGMAIKITIPGDANDKEKGSVVQDIILSTTPVFYPYQLEGIYPSMKGLLARHLLVRWYYLAKVGVKDALAAFGFLRKRTNPANLLEEIYYSGTPYKFGENEKIKWSAWPSKVVCPDDADSRTDAHFLTKKMQDDLQNNIPATGASDTVVKQPPEPSEKAIDYRVKFTLCVQFQEDEKTEPIENCSMNWKTKFHPVGVIKIPAQQVEVIENTGIDHGLWFSPGNALADHAPLGEVNKIRAGVYSTLAKERLSLKIKPTTDEHIDLGSNDPKTSHAEIKIITGNKSRSEV